MYTGACGIGNLQGIANLRVIAQLEMTICVGPLPWTLCNTLKNIQVLKHPIRIALFLPSALFCLGLRIVLFLNLYVALAFDFFYVAGQRESLH